MGSTGMTPQERVRSALSRAMLDTPRGRNEMASFVAQVVIAAAELKEAFEAEAGLCDNAPCGCLAVAAGWTRAGAEAVEFFDRVRSTHSYLGESSV